MKRRNLGIFIMLFICFYTSVSYALESQYEKQVARGISAIEAGRHVEAIEAFRAALKEKPDDHTATLYLGIAQSRSGDKEASATLKKALGLNPMDPRTNLELGVYYYGKNQRDEAEDYFENTVKLAPGTAFARKAEEYLQASKQGGKDRPYHLNLSLGGQYDSNVVLNPGDGPLPAGISDKADWRAVLNLKGSYDFLRKTNAEGSISYSFYQSLHARLTDFNLTQHLLEARAGYRISPVLSVKGIYSYEYLLVGGDKYDTAHAINPSLTISGGGGIATVLDYRYKSSRFKDSDLFVTNSERNGSNNMFGITQTVPVCQRVTAVFGYSHDRDNTRKDYWDYRGNRGWAELQIALPRNIRAGLNGEYYRKDYRGGNPLSDAGDRRKDRTSSAGVTITKTFSERLSVSLAQLFIRNKSNIDVFEYKRNITSLFLNVRL